MGVIFWSDPLAYVAPPLLTVSYGAPATAEPPGVIWGVNVSKANTYSVLGPEAGVSVSKSVAYVVLGPANIGVAVSKAALYVALAAPPPPPLPPGTPQIGWSSTFSIGSGTPAAYAQLAEVISIDVEDLDVGEVDVTHLTSPFATEESIPELVMPGDIKLICNYIGDATQQAIDTLAVGRTVFQWQITAPTGPATMVIMNGPGFITMKKTGPLEPNKKIELAVDIHATGPISIAIVASRIWGPSILSGLIQ